MSDWKLLPVTATLSKSDPSNNVYYTVPEIETSTDPESGESETDWWEIQTVTHSVSASRGTPKLTIYHSFNSSNCTTTITSEFDGGLSDFTHHFDLTLKYVDDSNTRHTTSEGWRALPDYKTIDLYSYTINNVSNVLIDVTVYEHLRSHLGKTMTDSQTYTLEVYYDYSVGVAKVREVVRTREQSRN